MAKVDEHMTLMENLSEKIHKTKGSLSSSSSSSSDSDNEKPKFHGSKKKRLFGRKESVHAVLGGGKSADIILWRNMQISGSILGGVTIIWLLFEWIGYHLLTFLCHSLIFLLAVLFLWSNAASFVNRSPPKYPDVILQEDVCVSIAQRVRYEANEAFATFRYVASGKDLKKFLMVIGGLWVISIIGSWFSFLTLSYIVFVLVYTLPVLYEKYEDHVDDAAEKAMIEINKQYKVLDAKVLQKIPRGPFSDKKEN